jgi:hypothetical protein
MSGTSMATPLVAGVAAGVWSQNPTWTRIQVWNRVRDTADNISAQNPSFGGLLGSGRVNFFNAVNTGGGGNTAPSVSISSPANGSTVTPGTSVTFTGSATDAQDGNISASLVWTSSLQGQIGTGASFARNDLVLGTHTITAQVTDSGGLNGAASVTLTVQNTVTPPAAPSNTTATNIGGGTARINWSDNSSNETGFQLQRQRWFGFFWSQTTTLGPTGANVTTFNNTPGSSGTYRYRVRAFNSAGNSAYSNWAQVGL